MLAFNSSGVPRRTMFVAHRDNAAVEIRKAGVGCAAHENGNITNYLPDQLQIKRSKGSQGQINTDPDSDI